MDFNVIIPMGGIGKRFEEKDYFWPKPFIKSKGKEILFWVIESLIKSNINNIFIPYNKSLKKYNFEEEISKNFPNTKFKFLCLEEDTKGASETVYRILKKMSPEELKKPFFTVDGDTFYKTDLLKIIKSSENGLIYFKDYNKQPIFSYIEFDQNNYLNKIAEKIKISNNANVGVYIFENGFRFIEYYLELETISSKKEQYISKIFELMINDNIKIKTYEINKEDFVCLGTPEQIIEFSYNNTNSEQIRVCFDLDNTLVTYPKESGNYKSCEPIQRNIDFLNKLKEENAYIIIHSARRMKTHKGNLENVKKDILELTKKQLKKFNINYDELILGKPYANLYIDDKATNAFLDLEKETGFYFKKNGETRDFNEIKYIKNNLVQKKSKNKNLKGEIYYYKNIPEKIKYLFPNMIESGKDYYIMEKINGISFSDLYLNDLLTKRDYENLFKALEQIHESSNNEKSNLNIYLNYKKKLNKRYSKFNYTKFKNYNEIYNFLNEKLEKYETENKGKIGVIHGDPAFTNIIINKQKNEIKFIDMRGLLGEEYSIFGDIFYDLAKIYHSIIGYDFIIKKHDFENIIIKKNEEIFKKYIITRWDENTYKNIQILTLSLLFTLIPLHEEYKHKEFWNLILNLYKKITKK